MFSDRRNSLWREANRLGPPVDENGDRGRRQFQWIAVQDDNVRLTSWTQRSRFDRPCLATAPGRSDGGEPHVPKSNPVPCPAAGDAHEITRLWLRRLCWGGSVMLNGRNSHDDAGPVEQADVDSVAAQHRLERLRKRSLSPAANHRHVRSGRWLAQASIPPLRRPARDWRCGVIALERQTRKRCRWSARH